jgi:hypothetical protein
MDRVPVHPVALVVVDGGERRVDGDLVEGGAAEARDLGFDMGVEAHGEQRIGDEVIEFLRMRR